MLLYFNVGQYGGIWRQIFSEVVLGIKVCSPLLRLDAAAAMTRSFNNVIYNNEFI